MEVLLAQRFGRVSYFKPEEKEGDSVQPSQHHPNRDPCLFDNIRGFPVMAAANSLSRMRSAYQAELTFNEDEASVSRQQVVDCSACRNLSKQNPLPRCKWQWHYDRNGIRDPET